MGRGDGCGWEGRRRWASARDGLSYGARRHLRRPRSPGVSYGPFLFRVADVLSPHIMGFESVVMAFDGLRAPPQYKRRGNGHEVTEGLCLRDGNRTDARPPRAPR